MRLPSECLEKPPPPKKKQYKNVCSCLFVNFVHLDNWFGSGLFNWETIPGKMYYSVQLGGGGICCSGPVILRSQAHSSNVWRQLAPHQLMMLGMRPRYAMHVCTGNENRVCYFCFFFDLYYHPAVSRATPGCVLRDHCGLG